MNFMFEWQEQRTLPTKTRQKYYNTTNDMLLTLLTVQYLEYNSYTTFTVFFFDYTPKYLANYNAKQVST